MRYYYDYDVALLLLRTNIVFDGITVAPIQFAQSGQPQQDGVEGLVAGWSSVRNKLFQYNCQNANNKPVQKKQVKIPYIISKHFPAFEHSLNLILQDFSSNVAHQFYDPDHSCASKSHPLGLLLPHFPWIVISILSFGFNFRGF